jgi:hypothetical protein
MDFRARSRALVTVPKRRSWPGTAEVSVPSGKFTNQLLEAKLGLEVLWAVSVTAIGVSPIDSETARAIASESTGTRVYSPA